MHISLVAMGMGDLSTMTREAWETIQSAQAIIGARRLLETLPEGYTAAKYPETNPAKILELVQQHPAWEHVCVVYSGDIGFYSGAQTLYPLLHGYTVHAICGVSSVQYFAAKLHRAWKDTHLVSLHGRDCDVIAQVINHPEVFFLTGTPIGPKEICLQLTQAGLGNAMVTVGEKLSYPDEKITQGKASELACVEFDSLSVMLVENTQTFHWPLATPGIPDDAFERGKTPMTKQEVRAITLAKLGLSATDVVYDIGAGTGSVSIETALLARYGKIYAIEQDASALELIEKNKQKFGCYNLHIVPGMAPEALQSLPTPDAAFIGGSKGQLADIVIALLDKNKNLRLAIAAITLETLAEAEKILKTQNFQDIEIVQVAINRGHSLGGYTMLSPLNPVFILSAKGAGA